ncbi:16S rRNA (cytosine1402-N4)-methyltransferase [Marinobacter salarius]|jgi:16S rRNA (cytosine1402-N4)-methyltransferase|uniref:Ribosomal RNA small subunit methyltransferase H n=2 Tax=Marinobacter TaxID=2742 RepID=W5YUC2_9GAMM|nr:MULTISPECIES: 16S rRNA (cytosine(1402)-N(4))-methyltransferase RsmH [Marinobacter]AHI32736.1 16S rRNA methyltransferase [Marinobacter salarius]KXJ44090.1 MAG: ribosomal RNA small subunit methyltransferase H [Marinobacter sp. Hex_13]MBS8233121.1 16S rRNA (cytosine(1402)-N(4))-methyltransferase RsmH [Marinobacter salarius]SFM00922.1 16S rRNA (cytosine1402-N4)-methyltransferase [Marinobacter salarius]|tara:strand:- start:3049 stop:4029 length:981 start_codon:yes stop_codon:yes gene_type:complete
MTAGRGQEPAGQYRHRSVLLDSAVDLLVNDPDGVYVDGTFGRGGHSRLILGRLGQGGKVLGIDKDPDAIQVARDLSASDARFQPFHGSFAELGAAAEAQGWMKVNGVLLDLGVSSPQLDDAARGFSFMRDGPLDMRMDPGQAPSAAQWLAEADEKDIANVIWRYGEEKFSRRIARLVVERRKEAPLETTRQLASLVSEAVPKKEKHKHPATRTFQAIRIFINRELEDLELGLNAAVEKLMPGGRLVVISFHSLEDRLVKRFMRDLARGPRLPKGVPVTAEQEASAFRLIGKANKADTEEVSDNVRARSAVMRVLERIPEQHKLGSA